MLTRCLRSFFNVVLSEQHGGQKSQQNGSAATALKLTPKDADKDITVTHSLNVKTNVHSAALLQGEKFAHVRCEVTPELDKSWGAP